MTMSIPAELKYSDSHEWARLEPDGNVSIGITHHAQDLLGDLVFVETPAVGRKLSKGEECGVVESVKAASDIYTPISGEVVAVNTELQTAPEKINEAAYEAWMFRVRPADKAELESLLDAAAYQKLVESEAH
jgi:glycine cleavage system H protein